MFGEFTEDAGLGELMVSILSPHSNFRQSRELYSNCRMEALLQELGQNDSYKLKKSVNFSRDDVSHAIARFAEALREALPLLKGECKIDTCDEGAGTINVDWLLSLVEQIPSELGPHRLARAVWEASQLADESSQQEALFTALGPSEEAMAILFQIAPRLPEIREKLSLAAFGGHSPQAPVEIVDAGEKRRQLLRQEALDAAQVAAIAQAEAEALTGPTRFDSTHSITRSSDLEAQKVAKKAAKRAAQAMKKARDAGAIIDEADLLAIDESIMGSGGLLRRSQDELEALKESLLPEGSRTFYKEQGLPTGTERDMNDEIGYEKVTIPPPFVDASTLHPRLRIKDIMDRDCAIAFTGVDSLNPMQSAVYDTAFNRRENMLVCAPTGAGKVSTAIWNEKS